MSIVEGSSLQHAQGSSVEAQLSIPHGQPHVVAHKCQAAKCVLVENRLELRPCLLGTGRIGAPEDIAQAVLFLADTSKAGFITGQELTIDGGVTAKLVYPE